MAILQPTFPAYEASQPHAFTAEATRHPKPNHEKGRLREGGERCQAFASFRAQVTQRQAGEAGEARQLQQAASRQCGGVGNGQGPQAGQRAELAERRIGHLHAATASQTRALVSGVHCSG